MRVLAAALAVLLLVAICSLAEADLRVSRSAPSFKNAESSPCCLSYVSRPVARSVISSAYMTSKTCPRPAVVLITRKGTQLCADPSASWVQKFLEDMKL
ncbi:C-C motif chemokine 3-like [Onychostruthus taczanowskii]|uniref:C-C motif chemokine 3-like n=1 Tax=Onychostruthus taczanowskii TaxID=356909 RepID=UPI001B80B603|nr:C-C motif chemokine 3-like [Onychostruthus taczanowskii]